MQYSLLTPVVHNQSYIHPSLTDLKDSTHRSCTPFPPPLLDHKYLSLIMPTPNSNSQLSPSQCYLPFPSSELPTSTPLPPHNPAQPISHLLPPSLRQHNAPDPNNTKHNPNTATAPSWGSACILRHPCCYFRRGSCRYNACR